MNLTRSSLALSLLALLITGCAGKQAPPVTEDKPAAFWPAPPDEPRIQFLTSINSSRDIAPARSRMEENLYGKEQDAGLDIDKPYGVAMANGCIYLTNARGQGVTVFDLRKKQTRIMGATGRITLKGPRDIAVAADGLKYVADLNQQAVVVFDAAERPLQLFPMGKDSRPVSVAVHDNLLYVTDLAPGVQRVRVLDRKSGKQLRTVGEPGGADGQFIQPIKVSVDRHGNLFVADAFKARIQKFSPDGKLLAAFGEAGNRPGNFSRPKHLAAASDGILYVVDSGFYNVQLFDEENKIMMYFGSGGTHPGAMDLPVGIAVNDGDLDLFEKHIHPAFKAERLIVVTNQFGDSKISVYAMGQLKPGKTLADLASRIDVDAPATQPAPVTPSNQAPTTAPADGAGRATFQRVP